MQTNRLEIYCASMRFKTRTQVTRSERAVVSSNATRGSLAVFCI